MKAGDALDEALSMPLVDQHCHGVRRDDLDRAAFESLITEGGPSPAGTTHFDSPVGLAVRRWCAPVLGLEPYAEPEAYLDRRRELGAEEVNRRLLRAAGIADFCVDTGPADETMLTPAEMGSLGDARGHEVVRIEEVAEDVAGRCPPATAYAAELADELARRADRAVGLKTAVAYRYGFDFDPRPPAPREVTQAASRWLAGPRRLTDPVLLRHALWTGADIAGDRELPLQIHTGIGDTDLTLHRVNPALLTDFIRIVPAPIVLLHCYPYIREAAYLAAVFPHVHADLGLTVTYTAASSARVIAEFLEMAPFHKILFSTDCYGLAELCHLGAHFFRRSLGAVLTERAGEWSSADIVRIARLIGADNARRLYSLNQA
ncbi:amidohydrolase family protein [Actinoallomurus rhizosphaericola]|uniref:amidohydrolase family protein n=1 Tax=Actinoallomurus rhizosphaericola TaxID=2952536 RepID=UPI002092DC45|nr:amidohydrolase family protein [Actinoallomurus rhizosphaericola]MCO5995434.1 amidohydrolase [Actinoallomurus rhizosphaericola]